jgi:hypothetical protein
LEAILSRAIRALARRPRAERGRAYCRSIFRTSTTRAQRAISRAMRVRISSGEVGYASPPSSASRCCTAGSARIARSSRFSRSITGCGVPGEVTMPSHDWASTPGSVSAIVGTSGNPGARDAVDSASGRIRPDLICTLENVIVSIITSIRPARSSVNAGAAPLNGTWIISVPASMLSHSPRRWCRLPTPADEKLTFPGAALARAMSSASDFTCESGSTEIAIGYWVTIEIIPKSFTGSYGRLFIITAEVGWPPVRSTRVWPSGAALATASCAMTPVAPTFCSTTTGCPRRSCSRCASRRDTMSVLPPGAKPT